MAIGYQTLYVNTGNANTAMGYQTMYNNTVGEHNVAVGNYALSNNNSGSESVAVGYNAGLNVVGNQNTLIGTSASFNGAGSRVTLLGYQASATVSNLSNATAIGADTRVGCNDCIVLGSFINGGFATKVGIGINSPTAMLEVQKVYSGVTAVANFKGTTNYSHFMFGTSEDTYIRAGLNGSAVVINDIPNGRTGIGTSNPITSLHLFVLGSAVRDGFMIERSVSQKWVVNNDFANDYSFYIFDGVNYPYRGYIDHVSGTYNALSDGTLKKDIQPLTGSEGLDKLMRLNPVRYHFKSSDRATYDYGFISQEVEKIFPDFVTEKEGIKMMGYSNFIPVLTKSIQEQQLEIESLKKEIEKLKKIIFKN